MLNHKLTKEQLASVEGLSTREAGELLGVSKSSVCRARTYYYGPAVPAKATKTSRKVNTLPDGAVVVEITGDAVPTTAAEIDAALRIRGIDPEKNRITQSFAQWDASEGVSFKAIAIPKDVKQDGPEWPVIQQAAPTIVRALSRTPKVSKWKTAAGLGDTQIGFRILDDGTMDPFHDESAISVALQIIEQENPDQVVFTGDMIDLPSQSRWAQEAAFARATQPAIDRTHLLCAQTRAAAPAAKIVLIEGNHDKRMQNFVQLNALSAFGLKQANLPDSWPVMSLPFLLRLNELDVQYMDAYPASVWWINDKLRAIHGTKANSNGSTASAYSNEMPHISTLFAHTHRQELQSKTTFDRMGKIRTMAINPGCLCRIDGHVPGTNSAVGINGEPVTRIENWQQGIVIIRYRESGEFFVEPVQIEDGMTVFGGQEFTA